jgi:hypothetical protein
MTEVHNNRYFEAWQNKDYHNPEPHYYFKDLEYLREKVKIILYYFFTAKVTKVFRNER